MSPSETQHTLLEHPQWGWSLDFSLALEKSFQKLPWGRVFQDMKGMESGQRVNDSEDRQVGHFWLRAPENAPTMGQATAIGETRTNVTEWVQSVRDGSLLLESAHEITDVIHIGMGGSCLGPQLLVEALGTSAGTRVHFLDNIDAHSVHLMMDTLSDKMANTLIVVLSKSGATLETLQLADEVFRRFKAAGHKPYARAVAITQPDSHLANRASREGWLAQFPIWDWVGGRFSATSAVGLFTAGLAGADTQALLLGAREMDQWTRNEDPALNPAARLAALWHTQRQGPKTRDFVVMPYSDRLQTLGAVLQQLLMESLGKGTTKRGAASPQGVAVYGNKGSSDQHALVQQLMEGQDHALVLFVQVLNEEGGQSSQQLALGDSLQHLLLGTRRALQNNKRPVITWTLPHVDAVAIGATIALFERAVGFYASMVDINAYDQPGVEAGKRASRAFNEVQKRLLERLAQRSCTLHMLSESLDADPIELGYLLQRLVLTNRVSCTGVGSQRVYRRTP